MAVAPHHASAQQHRLGHLCQPNHLYDARNGFAADFQSNFSFETFLLGAKCTGDGLTFFMAPANWTNNTENNGYGLGIFNKILGADNSQMIAIEFDMFYNDQFNENLGSNPTG
ncbi:hypothetical protein EJ110_NYTH12286 [Nymphaea thermarum]|nr:hypothetical protein EJ110_NYTH12286 [Nymphaea thermarum]